MLLTDIEYFKNVLRIVNPYAEAWHEWKGSKACFLTKKEIDSIESYLYFGSLNHCSEILNVSLLECSISIREALFKLSWRRNEFEHWKRFKVNQALIEVPFCLN
jgi:hypothetical protein